MKAIKLILAMALLATTSACGSDDDSSSGAAAPAAGDSEAEITADDGGELSVSDATLDVPAGALGEDTTLTVESSTLSSDLPESDTVAGLVYDFGPDGTVFEEPVELTLPLVGNPGDRDVVISWLDEENDEWVDLSTEVSGSDVTAMVEHFTSFVVRFTGGGGTTGGGGDVSCDDFSACGGDVVGEWSVQEVCFDLGDEQSPFDALCEGITFEVEFDAEGVVNIMAGGTYETSFGGDVTTHITFPEECLEAFQASSCADLEMIFDGGSCSDEADGCACSTTEPGETDVDTGTWEISGNSITTTSDEDGESETQEYCVQGNTMSIALEDEESSGVWVATR